MRPVASLSRGRTIWRCTGAPTLGRRPCSECPAAGREVSGLPGRPQPAVTLAPSPATQVRDLRVPVPAARFAQLAHEETHSGGAVQLHVRSLREALRETGQCQVPHAQKPPGPQTYLTCHAGGPQPLFICTLGRYVQTYQSPRQPLGLPQPQAGRRRSRSSLGRCPTLPHHIPPMELAHGTALLNCGKSAA